MFRSFLVNLAGLQKSLRKIVFILVKACFFDNFTDALSHVNIIDVKNASVMTELLLFFYL